jgi:DNA-binding transcriptional regulator YiaG
MQLTADPAKAISFIEPSWAEFDRFVNCGDLVANLLANLPDEEIEVEPVGLIDETLFADIEGMISERESSPEGLHSMRAARRWARDALYGNGNSSIRSLRLERGMSQAQLATAMDTNQATISRWERGPCNLEASSIVKLASVLEVPTVVMWGIAEAMLVQGNDDA